MPVNARSEVLTPTFGETVALKTFYDLDLGQKEVDYDRNKHPLDAFAKDTDKVIALPLAQLRHVNFVIQLELRLRRYKETSSDKKRKLLETAAFYQDLLEHAHRISNRFVRVCAHHMGLRYQEISNVAIPGGPLPRDMKEYQQWATQPDPAPCHRDQLFAVPDAERVTRLHQLRRLSRDNFG